MRNWMSKKKKEKKNKKGELRQKRETISQDTEKKDKIGK